jgi:membrane protease YdiL (CAAX protease family)
VIGRPSAPAIDRPAAPTIGARIAGRTDALGLATALGLAALLIRPALAPIPASGRVATLTVLYALVVAGSLLVPVVPVPLDHARLGRPAALALGLGGVAAAAMATGRPVPAPLGASALLLSLGAAVAEEALFRRAAYGWLARHGPGVAVAGSALLFALAHVPAYGVAAMPVDLGAGLLLSWQRWAAGTWTVPAATHAAANALAVMLR